ncbi:receptor-type tyrosine-protein phosphatase S-like isoform X2 [Phymastichus coffea]|uniref:receptor-type tyrosine-protein phosphatase S-like isoform X2 n=1 Tax=Phymastichus coffea TaxID=108790 RepID=UPI00273AD084|nr:receptor-type tyrosine-protein phosphatase S-like isoform X2 [Phymastichus coffea]
MKKLIVWIVLLSVTKYIYAELFVVSNSPKTTGDIFYPRHQAKEAYCITDDLDSALVWNHHLDWQFLKFAHSDESFKTYLLPRNQKFIYPANDNLNCWMNHTSECSRHWHGYGNWKFKNSIDSPTAPVTDRRWEDFDELKLNHLFRRVDVLPVSGSLAVSIRGSSDAHFAMCEGKNVIDSFCFYIILGGWKNTRSVIRKCEKGLPESTHTFPEGECAKILVENLGQVLSSTEWKHFVLKWNFEGEISIAIFDSSSMLLSYQVPKNRTYFSGERALNGHRYFLHARTSSQMLLKPHVYSYSLTTERQSKLMSPPIMLPNKYLCVDMSVSLCGKCTMTIDYVDYKETVKAAGIVLNKSPRNIFDLPVWQSVRVNKTMVMKNQTMRQPVKLVINTFVTDAETINPYWAISNVRRCDPDVLKIARVKTNQDSSDDYIWPNVTCQKMSANGRSTVIDVNNFVPTTKNSPSRPLCTEGTIGPSCSTNCSSLFWKHSDCQQLLACDNSGCSCAPGFMMPTCANPCPVSMYGYECEKTCGNCAQNLCKPSTGECTYGCANTENYYFLPPYCKIGIGPPPAPIIDILQFTWIKVSLQTLSEYKNISTNVTFEVWTNSGVLVFESDVIAVNKSTTHIDTDVENLSPGRHYRVISVVHVGQRTFRGQWTNFTTLCTESLPLNYVITSNETSIVVNNLVVVNDSCPDDWYSVQLLKDKDKLFDISSSFPITFSKLEPYTTYRLIVRSENSSTIVDKDVTTLEGAPGQVENFHSVSNHANNITVTWTSPDKPRGKIVNYTLEIKPIKSIGCSNYNLSFYNTTISQQLKQQITIANVSENPNKYTFSDLRPYTDYVITIYASTSRYRGIMDSSKCITKSTEMPTEIVTGVHLVSKKNIPRVAGVLKWDIPTDCSSIEGPMRAFSLYYKKLGDVNYKNIKALNNHSYALEKNLFEGAQTYEGRLHVLRDIGGMENKTAFAYFKVTLPPREPSPVRNLETVEVDVYNGKLTLRWEPPLPPIHGQLESYLIVYCNTEDDCNENKSISVKSNEFCDLWNSDIGYKLQNIYLCQTIPYPKNYNYITIKVQAQNKNVTKLSQPEFLQIINSESIPTAPSGLAIEIISPQNASVKISWAHPWKTGGRLHEFSIVSETIESNLTNVPWTTKNSTLTIDNENYKPQYNLIIDLLPSTTFIISIRGITVGEIYGKMKMSKITLPTFINISTEDLRPKVSHDLTIQIRIPQVTNNVVNSTMVIIVEGPKYCDEGSSNNEDINTYFNFQTSLYNKVVWKAATFTLPEKQSNKEFEIGNGLTYGGSKNYALCPSQSYIINLIISINTDVLLNRSHKSSGRNILKSIRTNAILIGEKSQNYVMWLTSILFIMLIVIILLMILHRKRLAKHFNNKSKVSQQENMPLSNDFDKKKTFGEGGTISIIKETKNVPNNLLVNDEPKEKFIMPLKLEDFEIYFERAYKSGALHKEYSTIQRGAIKACTYGSQSETKPKNRYANLFPYDESRVVLEKLPNDPYSDYINANFIKGYGEREKAYIATQGPKQHTVIDFWRMIWQEKVQIVCMMANLMENGKTKCEQYWPAAVEKKVLYGTVLVQFTSEEIHLDYTYRTFKVTCEEETRTVEHLHYTSWPDHGVPSNPGSIVAFLKEIHRLSPVPRKPDDPPIVVHCSAGVGRTGTLIVLDKCLCRAFSEQLIDIHGDVLSVREQRMNMVDNIEQYLLVHLVLVEYFNSKNTCFRCDEILPEKIAKAKHNASTQYQRILDTSWWNEVLGSPLVPEKSLSNINRAKHRFPESADSDYIAATNVRGIFKSSNYITTQLPLPSTSADFWRMLSEHNVELVLVLQKPDLNDSSYCELIPESQGFGNTKYLKVILQIGDTTSTECYTTEEVLLIDSSEHPIKDQTVKIITYKNWSEISLPPPSDIVKLCQLLEKHSKKQKCPIVIVCRDGVTACGLWLASSFLLDRMKIDKECDVSQSVRAIRRYRKNFLDKPKYLAYLYDIALAWSSENCGNVD